MFKIQNILATVKNINPRAENHGDETALACDIGLEFTVGNQMLNALDPELVTFLYHGDESSGQDNLDLEDNFLPNVRFPALGKLSWSYEGAGYTFQLIDDRLNGDHLVELADCKVNKIEFECEQGGTVKLSVRVQGNPSEEKIGELCHYIKSEVRASLLPPEKPEQIGLEEGEVQDALNEALEDDEERPDDEAMYTVAVEHVRTAGVASISNLQRAMQIGYNRAARLIERMEGDGVVSEMGSDGKRVVVEPETAEA